MISDQPYIGNQTRVAFAACGLAIGIISSALSFTLLIYYNQVMGLNASLAALALAIALVVDAVTDPVCGWWSDRLRSRFGRRHPFLFASLLPIVVGYIAVWYPPEGDVSQSTLFAYLLGCTILIRIGMTLFDVPSNALIAELTSDYDERTRLSSFKISASWMAANLSGMLLYAGWLNDRGGPPGSGLLRAEGYQQAGLVLGGATFILGVAMLALLHHNIPYLRSVSEGLERQSTRFSTAMRQLYQTYTNRSILAILGTAVFLAAAIGMTSALWVYFMQFYFRLTSNQLVYIQIVYLSAAVIAMFSLPVIARGRDKRSLTLKIAAAFWVVDLLPYALRTLGLFPSNGDAALFPILMVYSLVDGLLINMLMALVMSMLTDVVEDNLLKTGRREEGVVLAGQTLVSKASTALGTVAGGLLLSSINFPQLGAGALNIPERVLWNMGTYYWATMWVLGLLSWLILKGYTISRSDHDRNIAMLIDPYNKA